jgi:hypothetical protein
MLPRSNDVCLRDLAASSLEPRTGFRATATEDEGGRDDLLERGFLLAHFIFPERATAIQIVIGAVNKLKARCDREHKRAYWRDKFLKRQITRMTRDDEDTLQWLIYFESDIYEKAQEESGHSLAQGMIVRYVKSLVRIATGMSSFYVNIGIHRLLYSYSTSEAQQIYEVVSDRYRGADEYRRAKRLLMLRLESRFGSKLRIVKSEHGEARYELSENQGLWNELVSRCLQTFIPWSTRNACPAVKERRPSFSLPYDTLNGYPKEGVNQDRIEISRCHAFIDPVCSDRIVEALGLDPHAIKLAVPRFYMEPNDEAQPPLSRFPADIKLSEHERQLIADNLSLEESRRRKATARVFKFLADGAECARLDAHKQRDLKFKLPQASRLLEIWADDETGLLLLGTQIISLIGSSDRLRSPSKISLRDGQELILIFGETPADDTSYPVVSVSLRTRGISVEPIGVRVRRLFRQAPVFSASVMLGLALVILFFAWRAQRHKISEQARVASLSEELAHEGTAKAALEQPIAKTTAAPPVYRLIPDESLTRAGETVVDHPILLPATPALINLELPIVGESHSRYRAAVSPLGSNSELLIENQLAPVQSENRAVVVFSIPSNLLSADRDYSVSLRDAAGHQEISTFTFHAVRAQQ